jgi:uncharacterized repeat protein (TIGR01451 family)
MSLRRIIVALVLSTLLGASLFFLRGSHAQTGNPSLSGRFYRLDVIATNAQGTIVQVNPGPSLNDAGLVGLSAQGSGTNGGLYTGDGINALRTIRFQAFTAYSGSVQLTNTRLLLAQSLNTSTSAQFLSRFDLSQTTPPATIVAGANVAGFNDFNSLSTFASLNNNGQPAFGAVNGVNNNLVTGIRTTFSQVTLPPPSVNLRPMVADTGEVIVRAGAASDPIRLYNYALSTFTDIATVSANTFSVLGQSPGISDNGQVIVFYGDLTATGATALQTTAGPGIFASIVVGPGNTRRTIRVARRQVEQVQPPVGVPVGNRDGVCDVGEPCIDGELGLDAANNPLFFNSFSPDTRIGVVHQPFGLNDGIVNDTFIVCFLGTPNAASTAPQYFSNQLGLWTLRVDVKQDGANIREKPVRPVPVVQVNDFIGTRQITSLDINDPIALAKNDDAGVARVERRGDHRVVLRARSTAGGDIIVRGSHLDSDEDGLFDHWETNGIDFNQDGTIDLQLNQAPFNANPNRKDVFLEVDFMDATGINAHTHRPDRRPNGTPLVGATVMQAIRDSFASAPNDNPNGTFGITFHDFVDESIPEVRPLSFPARLPNAADDFDDLKFGSNGAPAGTPCGTGANDGHFGTTADRGSGNCANILGAKRLSFRYTIMSHELTNGAGTAPQPGVTGRAELPGNDFVVALPVTEPPGAPLDIEDIATTLAANWGTTFDQEFAGLMAPTLMHEFGHTLGLRHGGSDDINCKPNYLSLMNYARQSLYGGLARNIPMIADGTSVRTNAALDYSRGPGLPTLVESSLLEGAGIAGPDNARTIYGSPALLNNARVGPASGPINWNDNTVIDPAAVSVDINRITSVGGCGNASAGQTFVGHDDWANLRFNFYDVISFSDGTYRVTDPGGVEQTVVDLLNGGLGSTDIDGDGVSNAVDNCILASNPSQADSNGNGIGDACDPATSALANLTVAVAASANPAQLNTPFNYVVTVTNGGASAAGSVTLTDQLPTGATFGSATPSQGSCSGTSNLTCNLGTINNGNAATVTITVTPTVVGRLDNFASATSSTGDPNAGNNTGSVSTTVLNPAVTHSISGRVTNSVGNGMAGVTVFLGGSTSASTATNTNGDYTFAAVTAGGVYTVTPARVGYAFSPTVRTFPYLSSNQVGNFVGTQVRQPARKADFDGDSRTDVSIFRPSDGNWWKHLSLGDADEVSVWGVSTDKLVPGDYDGDGKTDLAVFRPSDTIWYILQSSNSVVTYQQWGLSSDVLVPGDYDGDTKTDRAVWRPSDGTWYVLRSSTGTLLGVQFGTNGDVPLVGDFDGDGKTDFAVFRPSDLTWYLLQSTAGAGGAAFGLATDKLAPGDYDGDGKTDYGVFRPSTGYWYTAPSTEPDPGHNFTALPFGASGDIPVVGDYDGDGKEDRALFRPSDTTWYILKSADLTTIQRQFGLSSDITVPSTYLPQ